MRKLQGIMLAVVAMVVSVLLTGCTNPPSDMRYVISSQYRNVVSISAATGGSVSNGSGVIIAKGGYVATNLHVIASRKPGQSLIFADSIEITHWTAYHYDGSFAKLERQDTKFRDNYTFEIADRLNASGGVITKNIIIDTQTITRNGITFDVDTKAAEKTESTKLYVVYYSEDEDLAILKAPRIASHKPSNSEFDFSNESVSLRTRASHSKLAMGEPVVAMGSSFGTMFRSSVGVITQFVSEYRVRVNGQNITMRDIVFHDATTIGGNSGGPLFDSMGRLVGINSMVSLARVVDANGNETSSLIPATGFSIAISSFTVLDAMEEAGII
jgi:S1-C subfamily serine protease